MGKCSVIDGNRRFLHKESRGTMSSYFQHVVFVYTSCGVIMYSVKALQPMVVMTEMVCYKMTHKAVVSISTLKHAKSLCDMEDVRHGRCTTRIF